jgi:heat shock protein HslJ
MRSPSLARTLLVAAVALSPACGESVLTGPSAVMGGVWKLQRIETTGGTAAVARPEDYTLEFMEAGRLAVRADCNRCSGSYELSGGDLPIGPLACTRAFCGSASSDVVFLDLLSSAKTLGVRGLELRIDSPRGVLRLSR